MSKAPLPLTCCPREPACAWSDHGRKHRFTKGVTRESTRRPNPAVYLPHLSAPSVHEALERRTVVAPDLHAGSYPLKTEYLRRAGEVIGWDDAEDADLSYVEWAGGSGTRTFHGRPMRAANPRAQEMLP